MSAEDFPTDHDVALGERIADWVAGDLDEESAAAVARLVAQDPALQEEVEFWRAVQHELPRAAHPSSIAAPGAGFSEVLKRRLRAESSAVPVAATRVLRMPQFWMPWAVAAAAVVAMTVLIAQPHLGASSPGSGVYFDEFGAAVQDPDGRMRETLMVSRSPSTAGSEPSPAPLLDHPEDRVWLGIWTKPIALEGFAHDRGLMLVRVAADSPAATAGLRPGDVILEVDSMATSTRWCIPHALQSRSPDQQIAITYWREGLAEPQQVWMKLGRCWE